MNTNSTTKALRLRKIALMSTAVSALVAPAAFAQDDDATDEIVVRGELRDTLEKSLELKREQTVVVDALVGTEIGNLPDISIAESLERITGVTAERFKGGSSAISVRGLGPFLAATFFNGREVTSGSDGRDVNFGQFPAELIGGAVVYKTQQASFIEGGIAANVELQTLRPLDFGKRRIQARAQLALNEAQQRVVDDNAIGGRYTLSIVDQFETGWGDFGFAIGGQLRDDTAPEDFFTTSSTFRPCNTIEGIDQSNNCDFDGGSTPAEGNGAVADAFAAGQEGFGAPFFFVSNQYIYRALQTEDDRQAVIANFQWQPTPDWDINLDFQYADRSDLERRFNLVIADGRRDIVPIEISPTGALLAHTGESRIENQSVFRVRDERFLAGGLNVDWQGERLSLAADVGYSRTDRDQDELDNRVRTNQRVTFMLDQRGLDVPELTFLDVSAVENDTGLTFDLNNADIFDDAPRARRRLEIIDDEILSFRLDGSYELDGFIKSVGFGARYSQRNRIQNDDIDSTINAPDSAALSPEVVASRRDRFPVLDLFGTANSRGIVNGLTFATFDPEAFFLAITGDPDFGLSELDDGDLDAGDTDLEEDILAFYTQFDYSTELGGIPVYGNIGVRAVNTSVTSTGISTDLQTMVVDGGDPGTDDDVIVVSPVPNSETINVETNEFWNILPSANLIFELQDNVLLRLAGYSAIARPNPSANTAALVFDDNAPLTDIGDIVTAAGNPQIEPLRSINFDASLEYYVSDDTAFTATVYHKILQTGLEGIIDEIILNVDNTLTPVLVGRQANSDDRSRITGFELSAQHVASYLPGFLGGFGFQASYNFADTNFQSPDVTTVAGEALADFTEPVSIPGFSRHSGNATVFWENDRTSIRLAYRGRSSFSRPFRQDANRTNGGTQFIDFSASQDLTDWLEFRVSALNLTNTINRRFRPTTDNLAETNIDGRRYFVELRARF